MPQLVRLFPLLLVLLVLMTAGAIRKSTRLYLDFRAELEKQGEGAAEASALRQYADCWYLPLYRSHLEPAALAAACLVTAAVFVRAAVLVIGEDTLFVSLAGEVETFKRNLFIGAYATGALFMLGSACFVWRSLRETGRAL